MKKGFTLMEVLVAILVMGLVSNGLMNLLYWGRLRYQALDEGWREREVLKSLHQKLRQHVSRGDLDAVADIARHFDRHFSTPFPLHCTSIDVKSYASDTVFIKPSLYIDRNRNGHEDPAEKLPAQVWCFRIRSRS